ncbi:hypothetical protein BH09MYX1_BH09MYX1_25470 [soil metagenome]
MTPDLAHLYRELTAAVDSGLLAFEPGHRSLRATTSLETVLRTLSGT